MIRARVVRANIRVARGLHTAAVIFLEPDAPFERLTSTQAKNLAMLNQALPLASIHMVRSRSGESVDPLCFVGRVQLVAARALARSCADLY
jgi:hypothetical protein